MAEAKTMRTAGGLREVLFDQIDRLRAGEIKPDEAKATAHLAKGIVDLTRLEIEAHRAMSSDPDLLSDFTSGDLVLGQKKMIGPAKVKEP